MGKEVLLVGGAQVWEGLQQDCCSAELLRRQRGLVRSYEELLL